VVCKVVKNRGGRKYFGNDEKKKYATKNISKKQEKI